MRRSVLEKKKHSAGRFALYASLVVVLLGLSLAGWMVVRLSTSDFVGAWEEREYLNLREVQTLAEYVRIDTSETTGSELAGAEFLAERLKAEGIDAHIEDLGNGKANLWAIIEGESPEALVLHHHIDVTPILRPDEWVSDPFEARLELPWIYGRGVFDMKSVAIAQLEAFLAVEKSGRRPARSLIFLATSSEETGSDLGTRRILKTHPELIDRFWAVLTEGGIVEAVSRDEIKYWGIEFAQKRIQPVVACASSRDRLDDLRDDLLAVWDARLSSSEPTVTPESIVFTEAYGPTRGSIHHRERLADPEAMFLNGWAWSELPEYLRSVFIDEAFPLDVRPGENGDWELPVNLLLRPRSGGPDLAEQLLAPWAHGVSLSVGEPIGSAVGSPIEHRAFTGLVQTVQQTYPKTTVGPYLLPWSVTDARFFREAGIPAYGFSPFLILTTDTLQVDQPNERIAIPGFVDGVALYRSVVEDLVFEG